MYRSLNGSIHVLSLADLPVIYSTMISLDNFNLLWSLCHCALSYMMMLPVLGRDGRCVWRRVAHCCARPARPDTRPAGCSTRPACQCSGAMAVCPAPCRALLCATCPPCCTSRHGQQSRALPASAVATSWRRGGRRAQRRVVRCSALLASPPDPPRRPVLSACLPGTLDTRHPPCGQSGCTPPRS